MAFGTAEFKYLAIITDESHAVTWVNWTGTEITLLYSHFNNLIGYKIIISLSPILLYTLHSYQ